MPIASAICACVPHSAERTRRSTCHNGAARLGERTGLSERLRDDARGPRCSGNPIGGPSMVEAISTRNALISNA